MNFKPSSPRLDSQSQDANPKKPSAAAPPKASTDASPAEKQQSPGQAGQGQVKAAASQTDAGDIDANDVVLENAMRIDQFRLRRQKNKLPREEFENRLKRSILQRRRRENASLDLQYPEELPITQYRQQIVDLIRTRQTIVVCGETGSGKSTQLPKFCLEAGLGRSATIGHTQPRRLAARSIASRLSEEMKCNLGEEVGYQVRFGDQTGPNTMVKLMTDGVLLAETGSDRFLDQYNAIIIDEAHERSLNIDFLIAYLRGLQSKRPDLKIIITSATIDADRFAEHFSDEEGPAPILQVEGRGYPVEIRYLPWEDVVDESTRTYDLAMHVIEGVVNLSKSGQGDTLVFLPTERDIRLVSHRVAGHYKRMGLEQRVEVLPLYARLPQKDQQRIFHPTGQKQRLIFATNVAESSLTVPGIRYVIDAGTARISRYSPRSKLQRLPIEPVSRASADQRAGRCGRVGPGICVRLYSTEDYESREAFTTPEIRRTNLASVVLQSKMLGFGSLDSLPLLDIPRPESIREGIQTLLELGAMDDHHELTEIGKKLGRLPVDPRIGRIVLAADELNVLPEVLPIAAALEIPDPRQRPQDQQQAADESHAEFKDVESDFLSYLRLWNFYDKAKSEHSRGKLTRVLRKRFLSPTRMREWSDTYRQLREMAQQLDRGGRRSNRKSNRQSGRKLGTVKLADDLSKCTLDKDRYTLVHQALLTGFLSSVAMAEEKNVYLGPRNLKLYLWPGSGVFESKPKWIMAAELVETTKQYARTVAKIQPQWIESVGKHILKDSYSDPHWSDKASGAFCYQRLSLFGLPVVVKRRVPLAPIDPGTARELLIEHGLVQQKLASNARFLRHNRGLRELIESLAAKTRRRDLVVDTFLVQQYYLQNLPEDVCDKGRLEKFSKSVPVPSWTKKLSNAAELSNWLHEAPAIECDPEACFMQPSDLIEMDAGVISQGDFPDQLVVGGSELPLRYRYEPGAEDDGVSLTIHQAAVTQISDDRLGWLVPGLLQPKIVSMIKSLPKRIRRNLVPAADVAKKITDELMEQYGQVPFLSAVCASMSRHAEMPVGSGDFQSEKLDAHLDFLVHVVDDDGETLAKSRTMAPLVEKFAGTQSVSDATNERSSDENLPVDPMQSFPEEPIPSEVVRERGGVRVAQYPALVDTGDAVLVRLFPDKATAEASHRQGLTRLFSIAERKELRRQVRWIPELEQTKIRLSGVVSAAKIEQTLIDLIARIAFVEKQTSVRSSQEFQALRDCRIERISDAVQQVAPWLANLGDTYLKMRGEIERFGKAHPQTMSDIKQQIAWLMQESFLSATPWEWLKHYPRYLKAISYRLDKVRSGAAQRDREGQESVKLLWDRWLNEFGPNDQSASLRASDEFRWMIEELRVSLFAQPLGTSIKISTTRCEKWLAKSR